MKAQRKKARNRDVRRRAVVAVQVAICSTLILGMGALAIDLGAMFTTQAELQTAADAAALAAAASLMGEQSGNPEELALAAADEFARRNPVLADSVGVAPGDIEFGHAAFQATTGKFVFEAGGEHYDAVRVTVRRTQGSEDGPMPLMFANIFGVGNANLEARAAAVLIPRDIAVVIDLSNSMCWDSELRYWNRWDGGYSNLRDVWCALDGPEPQRPYVPGSELESEYAAPADYGPTYGAMQEWGNPLIPGTYSASSDPGLWYIRKGQTCTVPAARAYLQSVGYSSTEINVLLSGSYDSSYDVQYRNRVACILGLAVWHSGMPGGLDPDGGNGNALVGELTWLPAPSYAADWGWWDYCTYSRSGFTYRYGLKTYTDFLLEKQPENYSTSNLWATPEQPLRAIKDAVQVLVNTITDLDNLDHISLETFATTSRHEVNLSDNLQRVADMLYQRQSGHYSRSTNIGGGLSRAIAELQSERARGSTRKIIVLMSDGVPNVDENGRGVSDGAEAATSWALDQAQEAADLGFQIYTVSLGYSVDRPLMQEIATIGGGQEFYASGNPDEYTEQLQLIFRTLGGKRPVALIE